MIFYKRGSDSVILKALQQIISDRIACYELAMGQSIHIDIDLRMALKNTVGSARLMQEKVAQRAGTATNRQSYRIATIFYLNWTQLSMSMTGGTRNMIVDLCLKNEQSTINRLARLVNKALPRHAHLTAIIEESANDCRRYLNQMELYREARSFLETRIAC